MRKLYLFLIIGIVLAGLVIGATITSVAINKDVKDKLEKDYSSYKLINISCSNGYCTSILEVSGTKGIVKNRVNYKEGDTIGRDKIISIYLNQISEGNEVPIKTTKPDEDITLTEK